eukprot:TRINITY_DN6470_c0_g1_i2.p2 TRINITY_DN6470_c0_g1~~TRINITY_DN6470_c0_g1_i2.p2  ORF type:complete len:136 (-),score=22.77 TRINITY_DN6470_c0_g1_i2:2434-2841(-)
MTAPSRRKRTHKAHRHTAYEGRKLPVRKDPDQIQEEMDRVPVHKLGKRSTLERLDPDPDLPGMGQFPCVECDRHFVDEYTMKAHKKSKMHKRRLKQLRDVPEDKRIQALLNPVDNGKKLRSAEGGDTNKDTAMKQ